MVREGVMSGALRVGMVAALAARVGGSPLVSPLTPLQVQKSL